MNYFAVFGCPIKHSLSPRIHHLFAQSVGISLRYEHIETPQGQLLPALLQFRAEGGCGANITLPLKTEAFDLCSHHSSFALAAKAVNTLYWDNNQLCGDNTDGQGFIRDLCHNQNLNLAGKRFLILGAGGAARSIVSSLIALDVKKMVIINRSLQTALALCAQDKRISAYSFEGFEDSDEERFDFVINATASSLYNTLLPLAPYWIKNSFVMDLAYDKYEKTFFQQWAFENGASKTHDGMGMLVEQGAIAFERWHNVMPDTKSVIKKLRGSLFPF